MVDVIVVVMMRGIMVGVFTGGHFAQQLREFVFVLAHIRMSGSPRRLPDPIELDYSGGDDWAK